MFGAAPMSPGGGPVGRGRKRRAAVSSWPLSTLGVPHGRPDGFNQDLLLSLGERGTGFVTCIAVAADTIRPTVSVTPAP